MQAMRASARAVLCLALLLPVAADEPSAALRGATPEPTAVGEVEHEDELQPLRQRYAEDIAALPPGESLIVCRGVTVCRRWGVVRGVRTCQGGFYCRSGAEVLAVSGDADAGEAEEPEEAQEPVEKAPAGVHRDLSCRAGSDLGASSPAAIGAIR